MFLYFIADATAPPSLKALQELGLGYAFDTNPFVRQVSDGPNGGHGHLAIAPERFRILGEFREDGTRGPDAELKKAYSPDPKQQTWVEAPLPGVWIGWWNDHLPSPESLQRAELVNGYALEMCDGQTWRFAAVCEADEETGERVCQLPCHYRMTPQRTLVPGEPLERVRWLWENTEAAWQAMVNGANQTKDNTVELVGKLLMANYYASDIELGALGAFGQTFAGDPVNIASLCLGYASWNSWKEAHETEGKSASETTGPSASSGHAA